MAVKEKTGCIRCGGSLSRVDGAIKCIACGWEATTAQERHRFYVEHKEAIIKDIKELGPKATREKWQIPSGTMTGLKSKWRILPEQLRPDERPEPKLEHLPQLPPWNDNWTPEVQIKWLDIFLHLATRGGDHGET